MEELYLPVLARCPAFNKSNGHFTWREEDPCRSLNTRKILEGGTTSHRGTQQQFSVISIRRSKYCQELSIT